MQQVLRECNTHTDGIERNQHLAGYWIGRDFGPNRPEAVVARSGKRTTFKVRGTGGFIAQRVATERSEVEGQVVHKVHNQMPFAVVISYPYTSCDQHAKEVMILMGTIPIFE